MKKTIVSAFLFAVACTAGLAQAQTAAPASQEFQYPSVRSRTAASRRPRRCASPSRARPGRRRRRRSAIPRPAGPSTNAAAGSRTAPQCPTRRCRPAWRNACASLNSAASSNSGAARTAGRGAPADEGGGGQGAIRRGQGTLVRRLPQAFEFHDFLRMRRRLRHVHSTVGWSRPSTRCCRSRTASPPCRRPSSSMTKTTRSAMAGAPSPTIWPATTGA